MNCPDCGNTKAPEAIPLEFKQHSEGNLECPACGGVFYRGVWLSAPKYPKTDKDFFDVMGRKKKSNAVKINGVWKNP